MSVLFNMLYIFVIAFLPRKHLSVQFSRSVMSSSLQPHGLQLARLPCSSLCPGICWLMSTESVMPSNHLILCHPLFLLPSISPSIRVFSYKLALYVRRPKSWSFHFSISHSNGYPGLVSFRIDWFSLIAVQGTVKSFLQHHCSKSSILWYSVFFMVQLTSVYDYWKNHSFDYMHLCWESDMFSF